MKQSKANEYQTVLKNAIENTPFPILSKWKYNASEALEIIEKDRENILTMSSIHDAVSKAIEITPYLLLSKKTYKASEVLSTIEIDRNHLIVWYADYLRRIIISL